MANSNNSLFHFVSTPAPRYLLRLGILQTLFNKYLTGTNKRFLEIGPGNGDVSAFLLQQPAIAEGLLIDQAEKSASLIKARLHDHTNCEVHCADILAVQSGEFDYVLSFEVLEHIDDDRAFMQAVGTKLAKSGLWFISVPAYMSKWQKQDEYSGHVRRYEEAELNEKLQAAGFQVIELIDYGFPLTSLMRPFRDSYYHDDSERSNLSKTLDSGTEGRMFSKRSLGLMRLLLLPFRILQYLFAPLRLGDGFIVVARKI